MKIQVPGQGQGSQSFFPIVHHLNLLQMRDAQETANNTLGCLVPEWEVGEQSPSKSPAKSGLGWGGPLPCLSPRHYGTRTQAEPPRCVPRFLWGLESSHGTQASPHWCDLVTAQSHSGREAGVKSKKPDRTRTPRPGRKWLTPIWEGRETARGKNV